MFFFFLFLNTQSALSSKTVRGSNLVKQVTISVPTEYLNYCNVNVVCILVYKSHFGCSVNGDIPNTKGIPKILFVITFFYNRDQTEK